MHKKPYRTDIGIIMKTDIAFVAEQAASPANATRACQPPLRDQYTPNDHLAELHNGNNSMLQVLTVI